VLAENARALEAGGMGLVDDVLTQVLRLKRPAPEAPRARSPPGRRVTRVRGRGRAQAREGAAVLVLDSTHRLLPALAARGAALGWRAAQPRWAVDVAGGSKNVLLLRRAQAGAGAGATEAGVAGHPPPEWTRRPQRGVVRALQLREEYRARELEQAARVGGAAEVRGGGDAAVAPRGGAPVE